MGNYYADVMIINFTAVSSVFDSVTKKYLMGDV